MNKPSPFSINLNDYRLFPRTPEEQADADAAEEILRDCSSERIDIVDDDLVLNATILET